MIYLLYRWFEMLPPQFWRFAGLFLLYYRTNEFFEENLSCSRVHVAYGHFFCVHLWNIWRKTMVRAWGAKNLHYNQELNLDHLNKALRFSCIFLVLFPVLISHRAVLLTSPVGIFIVVILIVSAVFWLTVLIVVFKYSSWRLFCDKNTAKLYEVAKFTPVVACTGKVGI